MREQLSFTGGELSPYLHGRTDLAVYGNGLAELRNGFVRPTGAVEKRPGTLLCGNAPSLGDLPCRFIPYILSETASYALAFVNTATSTVKVWVLAGGAFVDAVEKFTLPWAATAAQMASATFAQDGERLILCCAGFPPLEVKLSGATWSCGLKSFSPLIDTPIAVTAVPANIGTATGRTYRMCYAFQKGADIFYGPASAPFVLTTDVTLNATTDKAYLVTPRRDDIHGAFPSGGVTFWAYILLSDKLTTPWDTEYFGGVSAASVDPGEFAEVVVDSNTLVALPEPVLLIGSVAPVAGDGVNGDFWYDLTSGLLYGPKAAGAWPAGGAVNSLVTALPEWIDGTVTSAVATSTSRAGWSNYTYKVVAVAKGTKERSKPSLSVTIFSNYGDAKYSARITWDAVSGAEKYEVYRSTNGGKFGRVGETKATQFQDLRFAEGESLLEDILDFGLAENWPRAVAFYQQRLCFAGSAAKPMGLWFSRTGEYNNFSKHNPVQDDDGFGVTITAADTNEIRHLIGMDSLLALTSAGEWAVTAGGGVGDALKPTSITVRPQGRRGSETVSPLLVEDAALYLQAGGAALRGIAYSFEADGFKGDELSLLAAHLLSDSPGVSMAFCKRPHGQLWVARADGKLATATMLRDQQINAWSLSEISGAVVKSLCSIPEGGEDRLYLAMSFGGALRFCRLARQADLVYADLAKVGSITGLAHLDGRSGAAGTLAVMDKSTMAIYEECSVSGGALLGLPVEDPVIDPAGLVIGVPYTWSIRTLPDEAGRPQGARQGRAQIRCRIRHSYGLKFRPDDGRSLWSELKPRGSQPAGTLPELDGQFIAAMACSQEAQQAVELQQPYPLPLALLTLSVD
jgi:hypothetical protein